MPAGELLKKPVERFARGAIAGVPADAEGLAVETFEQAIDIFVENIGVGYGAALALVPVCGGGTAAERLDFLAEHRAAVQHHLEAVVVSRIVAAGDLDPTADF